MDKLTEFVTNSFTDTTEIKFVHKGSTPTKHEPLSPARSNQSNGSPGLEMEADRHNRNDAFSANNNEEILPKREKGKHRINLTSSSSTFFAVTGRVG
jgi:hypothetical protein